jgi:hypothetical protein
MVFSRQLKSIRFPAQRANRLGVKAIHDYCAPYTNHCTILLTQGRNLVWRDHIPVADMAYFR